MRDIEMNLHNDLKENHGQLEHLHFAFIYILVTHKEISKFTTHLSGTSHKSII
jgi:hypothetical protein